MNKNEIIKELEKIIEVVENREAFTEEHGLKEDGYYPGAYGYLIASLQVIVDHERGNIACQD